MKKIVVITSHPIQYNAPLFAKLTSRGNVSVKVFYTWEQAQNKVYDPGFGIAREWDIPLLNGYTYEFVPNTSDAPGSHHFKGIINPNLIEKIKKENPDAILVFGWAFHSHLKVMRYFHGKIPVLFRGDSTLLDEPAGFSIKKILRRLSLRWVFRHIDKAIYVGSSNKEYFIKHGVGNTNLSFAPHAIDNSRFEENDAEKMEQAKQWRRQLNIPDHALVFLFAGKLEPKKDPELLINAFKQMQAETEHLVLVGNGVLESTLKEKYGQDPNIHFVDFQNQLKMPIVYRIGDVYVLPSQGPGETWGLAVNEAMACGLPVIASSKCGCAVDLIIEGENGFIFNATDVDSLKEKLLLCKNKQNDLRKMAERSKQVIANWTFDAICEKIETVIEKL